MKFRKNIRLAIIDDSSRYVQQFTEAISNVLKDTKEGKVTLYLPKSAVFGKTPTSTFALNCSKRVWSSFFYPQQILRAIIADRINVVHIQLEMNTFGHPITILLFPSLLLGLRILHVKVILTVHAVFPRGDKERYSEPFLSSTAVSLFLICFYKFIGSFSSRIIVHSSVFRHWLIEYGLNFDQVQVIPHGVTFCSSSRNGVEYSQGKEKIILCFGVLSPRKGLELLIQAFQIVSKKHSDTTLILAGHEPRYFKGYKLILQNLTKKLGIDERVRFVDTVPEQDIEALFVKAKLVVLPYTYSISASGPLTIALQYAKPIIAANTQFFKTELTDGLNCVLVNNNSEDLALAIIRLIENRELCKKISRGAKELSELHSWNIIAKQSLIQYGFQRS
jgi:glycosyltransferase involved in cell wall biosynthesis